MFLKFDKKFKANSNFYKKFVPLLKQIGRRLIDRQILHSHTSVKLKAKTILKKTSIPFWTLKVFFPSKIWKVKACNWIEKGWDTKKFRHRRICLQFISAIYPFFYSFIPLTWIYIRKAQTINLYNACVSNGQKECSYEIAFSRMSSWYIIYL